MTTVTFIDNSGAGFAGQIEVASETTIAQLFADRFDNADPNDYKIRVNRSSVPRSYILRNDDTVSITPTKVKGA